MLFGYADCASNKHDLEYGIKSVETAVHTNVYIIHSSYPSLCIGENHGTVLEC